MINQPSLDELAALPAIYSAKQANLYERPIGMHFYLGRFDWFASEFDPKGREFYGCTTLNGDYRNADWNYFTLLDLQQIRNDAGDPVTRDLNWRQQSYGDVVQRLIRMQFYLGRFDWTPGR